MLNYLFRDLNGYLDLKTRGSKIKLFFLLISRGSNGSPMGTRAYGKFLGLRLRADGLGSGLQIIENGGEGGLCALFAVAGSCL